jgi:hypothetical protein
MKIMAKRNEQLAERNQMLSTGTPAPASPAPKPMYDAAAMEAEIAAVREKYLGGVRDRLDDFRAKRVEMDAEIAELEKALGIEPGQLTDAAKAKAESDVLTFAKGEQNGIGRAAAIAKVGLDKAQTGRLLKGLVAAGKLRKDGKGSKVRYFAA